MSEPETYESPALPGICPDCGGPMRIKTTTGRCARCNSPWPRVLCRGYETASGAHIICADPVIKEGDPGGQVIEGECGMCAEMRRQAEAIRQARGVRAVMRRAREKHPVREMTDEDWEALR